MKGFLKLLLVPVVSTALFAKSEILIEPEEAAKLIGKENVMFISGDNPDSFELNNIVGSIEMYAHGLQSSDIMGHVPCAPLFACIEEAEELISSKGITNDMTIIAYDDFRGPNATGVYHYFKSWGHEDVRLLNGGLRAMQEVDPNQKVYDALEEKINAERMKLREVYRSYDRGTAEYDKYLQKHNDYVEKMQPKLDEARSKLYVQPGSPPELEPTDYRIDPAKIDTTYLASKEDVYYAMQDILEVGQDKSKYVILDTRGINEFAGERYLDNVARAGHVPGATFVEWDNITDFDNSRSFRSLDEMEQFFKDSGITRDRTIYAYCHVGAGRSSHLITALQLLGYENVKIYSGSWNEWGNDMNLPIRR